MPERFRESSLRPLLLAVDELRTAMLEHAWRHRAAIDAAAPELVRSARNLVHYLAVRSRDVRPLQRDLARLGLSSLGRLEPCALHTLDAVSSTLRRLLGEEALPPTDPGLLPDTDTGPELLAAHARQLLGETPPDHRARVMVTMPSEAADDPQLARDLLDAGMQVARINTAHDDAERWTRMVEHLRRAGRERSRPCRILADLAGPKLRTGPLRPGPAVLRIKPARDRLGRVTRPAEVWFRTAGRGGSPTSSGAQVPLEAPGLAGARAGDEIVVRDARGRTRRFAVRGDDDGGVGAELERTAYLVPGSELRLRRGGEVLATARVADLPVRPGCLELRAGDELLLTRDQTPGGPCAGDGAVRGSIPCTLTDVFEHARVGQPIWFDDGQLGGVVIARQGPDLRIRVDNAQDRGFRLRAGKGINLPETELPTHALTDDDVANLDWVVEHTDLVGLSFVRSPDAVRMLHDELRRRSRRPGVIVKIETRQGFARLPEILLEGLRWPPFGVMVARGDLAVEVGFARLAELQEEILWLCEAAHVPVIWATQVLENLAKTGQPSRAEVTDAAMGVRAECVMLNKGPFAAAAVRFLETVLGRMQAHQDKKRTMLRRLAVADGLSPQPPAAPPPAS